MLENVIMITTRSKVKNSTSSIIPIGALPNTRKAIIKMSIQRRLRTSERNERVLKFGMPIGWSILYKYNLLIPLI